MILRQGILSKVTQASGNAANLVVYSVPANVEYADVKVIVRGGTNVMQLWQGPDPQMWQRNEFTARVTSSTVDYTYPSNTFRVMAGTYLLLQIIGASWFGDIEATVVGVEYQRINGSKYRFKHFGASSFTRITGSYVFNTVYTVPDDVQYAVINPRITQIDNTEYSRVQILRADGHIARCGGCLANRLQGAQTPALEQTGIMVSGDSLQLMLRRGTSLETSSASGISVDVHEHLK